MAYYITVKAITYTSNGMKYSGPLFGELKMLNLKDQKQHKKSL